MSIILSALFILSLFPLNLFATTSAPSSDGYWEQKETNYCNMTVGPTNFNFTQTTDNEEFGVSVIFLTKKLKSTNYLWLNTINTNANNSHAGSSSGTWTWSDLGAEPDNYPSGDVNNPNNVGVSDTNTIWTYNYTFTGEGSATYDVIWDINYTSGQTRVINDATHSTLTDGNTPTLTITVSDARPLLRIIQRANDVINNPGEDLSQATLTSLANAVNQAIAGLNLDGTVYYPQERLDQAAEIVEDFFPADFTAYSEALDYAQEVLNSNMYTAEEKAAVQQYVDHSSTVYQWAIPRQNDVDAETAAIYDLIRSFRPDDVVTPNQINNTSNANAYVSQFYCTEEGSTSIVNITLNHSTVYMDISEDLSDTGLTWTYYASFQNAHEVSGPLSTNCLGSSRKAGINNSIQPANFDTYFTNYAKAGFEDAASLSLLPNTANGTGEQTVSVLLDGKPLQTTDDSGVVVNLGYYWKHSKSGTLGIGAYTRYSYDKFALSEGYSEPKFTVVIYDKAPLAAAINAANGELRENVANYAEYQAVIDAAADVYNTREVTPSQITAAINAIQNFEFKYSVNIAPSDSAVGIVSTRLVSGTLYAGDLYSADSIITTTATVINPDYDFVGWSDGNTDNPRTISMTENVDLTAVFEFIPADYSELNALIDQFNNTDKSSWTQESKDAIETLIDSFNPGLGRSNQGTVDNYVDTLTNALENNVEYLPCDYSALNAALNESENIPATNDGRYPTDFWNDYQTALTAATNLDKNLTQISPDNQTLIDNTAAALEAAIADLGNNMYPVIYVNDETGNEIAQVPVPNDGENPVTFGDIKDEIPTPATDDDHEFYGWADENGDLISDETVITDDMEITAVTDVSRVNIDDESDLWIDRTDPNDPIIGGIDENTTAGDIKDEFNNDATTIIILRNDIELSDDDLVGTGCIVRVVSAHDHNVIYEQSTVILYGDVNGDGLIDSDDYNVVKNYIYCAEGLEIGTIYYKAADTDRDTAVDAFEMFSIDKYINGYAQITQELI